MCFSNARAGRPEAVLEGHGGHRTGEAVQGDHPDRDLTGLCAGFVLNTHFNKLYSCMTQSVAVS